MDTSVSTLCQSGGVSDEDATRDELIATVTRLRAEVERLREELRRARQDRFEVPPHY